jgi:two-component system, OmpR family, phosphate regulon sensor histidine kinase PhoR
MENLQTFLDKLSTAAIIFRQSNNKWKVEQWNTALETLREASGKLLKGKQPKEFIQVDAKANAPFLQGKSVKPLDGLAVHTALLKTDSQQQIRVKLKYDWIDAQTMLLWIEPFSEDMALTQAHADFVSTVSHEFRTPLTSIKGFADTLLRYGGNLDPEQQKRFINIIKHQADRLTRLVENLLTASKLGAQKTSFIFRPIPVKRTVERIVQSVEGKLVEPRVFKVQIPHDLPEVWADPDKLEQVLLNLIDNATKYSYAESEVKILAQLCAEDTDKIKIDICDSGVGIPQEHLPNIFNKFSRIDNPLTREVEGTGLGLYITKSLTHAMGGEISVTSENQKGSTFTVILPVATPERQAAARLETEEDSL